MNLRDIMANYISQIERQILYDFTVMWNLKIIKIKSLAHRNRE